MKKTNATNVTLTPEQFKGVLFAIDEAITNNQTTINGLTPETFNTSEQQKELAARRHNLQELKKFKAELLALRKQAVA